RAAHGASHFCHLLARVARGDLRLTQTGELHRKSLQELARGFGTGDMLSDATGLEEAVFLFRFAADAELMAEEDGVLRLSPRAAEWLEDGGEELGHRLRDWWLRRRSRGLSRLLDALAAPGAAGTEAPARAVSALAPLFAVYEG